MKLSDYKKLGVPFEDLPLRILSNIDIDTPDEEKIVQELINKRLQKEPLPRNVVINRPTDNTDFKTPEEEAEFQKVINERVAEAKPKVEEEVKTKIVGKSRKT